jgi:hypothetical protein
MRYSMNLEYMIHEKLIHSGCSKWMLKSTKMSILGKTINYTMMSDLFPNLGNPTIKSIEMSLQIVGRIGSSWSVLGDLIV